MRSIQTKKSTQSHLPIMGYGISSLKGLDDSVNTHQIAVCLNSKLKQFILIESFNGHFAANFVKK